MNDAITVAPARTVTIPLAAACLGLTEKAIRRKIADGVWVVGREFFKAPDGRIYIDLRAVEKWVAMGLDSPRPRQASASIYPSPASA